MPLRFELNPPLSAALRAELVSIWADVSNAGGAVGFSTGVTVEDVLSVAAPALDAAGDGDNHLLIAYRDEEVAGFLFLVHRPGPLFRHWVTVKRLQVRPTLQGNGIGGALLDQAADVGRRLGLEQIHLTVRGGTGTEAFYERHGYRVIATIPEVIRLGPGDDRDEIYMLRRL